MSMTRYCCVSGTGRVVEICLTSPRWRPGRWVAIRTALCRPSLVKTRKPTSISAEKSGQRQSYDDLTQSYTRSLQREDAQLTATTPVLVHLAEFLEGVCLVAALTLQLLPVVYALVQQQRRTGGPRMTDQLKEKTSEETADEVTTVVEHQQRVVEMAPDTSILTLDRSQFSMISVLALMIGVILGRMVRRFRDRQWEQQRLQFQSSPSLIQAIEHQEMENSISRAFTEMSHLAGQFDKLRVKVRVLSRDYRTDTEKATSQSSHFKQALLECMGQVKSTEAKIEDLQTILDKMQGFQSKQFEVVSTALRRLDQECKSLQARLPPVETEEESTASPAEIEQSTVSSPADVSS